MTEGKFVEVLNSILNIVGKAIAEHIVSKTVIQSPALTPATASPKEIETKVNELLEEKVEDYELKIAYLSAAAMGETYRGEFPSVPDNGTCWSCLWFSGRICNREGSKRNHKPVLIWTDACDLYKHTDIPRAGTVSKHGEGMLIQHGPTTCKDYISPQIKKRRTPTYRRAMCDKCGTTHTINSHGNLYPHDTSGVSFRLGHGNRNKPCDGKPILD